MVLKRREKYPFSRLLFLTLLILRVVSSIIFTDFKFCRTLHSSKFSRKFHTLHLNNLARFGCMEDICIVIINGWLDE